MLMHQFRQACAIVDPADRYKIVVLAALLVVNSVFELLGFGLILPLLRLMEDPGSVLQHDKLKYAYDWLGFVDPRMFLIAASILFLIVYLIKGCVYVISTNYQSRFTALGASVVSKRLYRLYLRAPYLLHLRRNSAELIAMIDRSAGMVFYGVLVSFASLFTEALIVVGIFAILVLAEPVITLVVGVVMGTLFAAIYSSLKQRLSAYGARQLELTTLYLQSLKEGFGAVKEVKVFGREEYFVDDFSSRHLEFSRLTSVLTALTALPRVVVESLMIVGIVGVMTLIVLQKRDSSDIIAALGLFAVAAFRIVPSLNRIMAALGQIKRGTKGTQILYDDMKLLFDMADQSFALKKGRDRDFRFEDRIAVEDAVFVYPDRDKRVLDGVSFSIARGESVGIVGPSGSGKSTLVDVMLGLLKLESGRVTADGHDVGANPRPWLCNVGYVPQMVTLIDDQLRRNIAFGLPDSEIEDARLWRSLEMANLAEFVRGLPRGLDTIVGENGVQLSGGQRQRVGIARALYHDPAVLFMDEATSALDGATEKEINAAINALQGDKTLVIIAHRLSTVRRCSRLILMKEGRVVDMGTFDQLVERCPEFNHMVQLANLVADGPEDLMALN